MSKEEITAIVNAITSLITVLRDTDPHDKAEIYGQLGLRLTYYPSPRTVSARAETRAAMYEMVVSEGGLVAYVHACHHR